MIFNYFELKGYNYNIVGKATPTLFTYLICLLILHI